VAVSPAPTALIESIIQINKAYKCTFVNENAVKAEAYIEGAFSAPSNPLADAILYEQFSHKCYSLKNFSW